MRKRRQRGPKSPLRFRLLHHVTGCTGEIRSLTREDVKAYAHRVAATTVCSAAIAYTFLRPRALSVDVGGTLVKRGSADYYYIYNIYIVTSSPYIYGDIRKAAAA